MTIKNMRLSFWRLIPNTSKRVHFNDAAARFRREGGRGAYLDHPHLIRIHAYCENEDGGAFESSEPKNPFY